VPELPEVETVRRTLLPHLAGATIVAAEVRLEAYLRDCTGPELEAGVAGRSVTGLERHGKYLYFMLDGAELEAHLGMTGRITVAPGRAPLVPHTHVVMSLDCGQELRFTDPRRFGFLGLRSPGAAAARRQALGPEPLTAAFTRESLYSVLCRRRAPVKALLLNQRLVAGLGNIYVDEVLHRARLHPERPGSSLDDREIDRLHRTTAEVIAEAVAARGTSFSDYVDGEGRAGSYVERLRVYGREGQPCPECGTPLARIQVAGRSSHHCPRCQPLNP
jgi:formamidopyrimidine-DNA glycosylase